MTGILTTQVELLQSGAKPYICPSMFTAERVYLTWPASLPCVATVRAQWRRNAAGEIEAWYTRRQLAECVAMMKAARGMQA